MLNFFHGFSLRKDKTLFSLEGDFKVVVLDPEFLSTSSNPGGGVILLPRIYELGKEWKKNTFLFSPYIYIETFIYPLFLQCLVHRIHSQKVEFHQLDWSIGHQNWLFPWPEMICVFENYSNNTGKLFFEIELFFSE